MDIEVSTPRTSGTFCHAAMRTRNAQYAPPKRKSGKAGSGPQEVTRGRGTVVHRKLSSLPEDKQITDVSNALEAGRPPKRAAETASEDPVAKKKGPQKSKDVKNTHQAERAGKAVVGNPRGEQSAAQAAATSPAGRPQQASTRTLSGGSPLQRPAPASPYVQQPAHSPQRAAGV